MASSIPNLTPGVQRLFKIITPTIQTKDKLPEGCPNTFLVPADLIAGSVTKGVAIPVFTVAKEDRGAYKIDGYNDYGVIFQSTDMGTSPGSRLSFQG